MEIDQAKYFNFIVKDIDNAQSNPKLVDAAMVRAPSYNMNNIMDSLANLLVTGTATANVLYGDDSPIVPTSETAYNLLVDMGVTQRGQRTHVWPLGGGSPLVPRSAAEG